MYPKRLLTLLSLVLVIGLLASCTGLVLEPVPAEGGDAAVAEATEPPAEEAAAEATEAPAEEAAGEWMAPEDALVSIPAAEAPTLDGVGDEAVWAEAPAITVGVQNGANMGESEVTIKSVYGDGNVYFLVSWADPTESFIRSPWMKNEDGTWGKMKDPDDRGGDNNVYYEDKMSFIWDINNSIPDFARMGCFNACHDGENEEVKPYGNKYTEEEGQLGDIWHWKSVRNLGQIDDQYLDHVRYSPETAGAGRHSDPSDGGGYVNNDAEGGATPMWMGPEGFPRDGSPGYILEEEKLPFDDSLFAAGDMIPGITKSPFTGDRGNISAGWQYADGVWTVELGRTLETGSEFDVQFSDLSAPYYFGVAVFDNAQVRHAYQRGAETLVFQP